MPTIAKVLIGIAIVFVGTIVLLGLTGVYIARNMHVQESGTGDRKTVNIDTPFGHMTVHADNQLNPESVGIPIYPGASRSSKTDKGGADVQIDAGGIHKDFTVAAAQYDTFDPPEKVEEFYEHKFPNWSRHWENGGWRIETNDNGKVRTIAVRREGDHTRIGVASLGAPASN
jgi:hypothetical protein